MALTGFNQVREMTGSSSEMFSLPHYQEWIWEAMEQLEFSYINTGCVKCYNTKKNLGSFL